MHKDPLSLQEGARCPVCETAGESVKHLSAEFIKESLALYYAQSIPAHVIIGDYNIIRCPKCTLEYASPMIPGSDAFYTWISEFEDYYPGVRWEWSVVLNEIRESGSARKSLLDVGCGSGAFLRRAASSLANVAPIGLDPTGSSILQCRAQGLEAYSETLQEYAAHSGHKQKQFDYICAFHCLEHVSDPRDLLRSVIPLTHSGSRIFFSTPYSPMSFETNWYDPLNHPPHHLTRWNAKAYHELAAQAGCRVELLAPRAGNPIVRALNAVNLSVWGPRGNRRHPLVTVLRNPLAFAAEFGHQLLRERLFGLAAPDVILAKFRPGHGAIA